MTGHNSIMYDMPHEGQVWAVIKLRRGANDTRKLSGNTPKPKLDIDIENIHAVAYSNKQVERE